MHLVWIICLIILFVLFSTLVWAFFFLAKDNETQFDDEFLDTTTYQQISFNDSELSMTKDKQSSFSLSNFIKQYLEETKNMKSKPLLYGIKHLKSINKEIQKDDYFRHSPMEEKLKKIKKNNKRNNSIHLPTIYENATYFKKEVQNQMYE